MQHTGEIELAKPSKNQLMRTFKYNDANLWITLDISVRGNPSLNSFNSAYLKDYVNSKIISNGFMFLK